MQIHPKITGVDVSGLGGVWVFIVRGERTALIDTGPKAAFPISPLARTAKEGGPPVLQVLPPALEDLGLTMADIDLILNTHIHFDHNGGNAAVKAASGAEIAIHESEAHYLAEPGLLFDREQAPMLELVMGKDSLAGQKKAFLEGVATGPGPYAPVGRTLVDGDIVDLGGGCELKVVSLPGHTEGSIGFYWEKEGLMLGGDALQGVCGHRGGLPILDDPAAISGSFERAKQMPLVTLAHSHPFRGLSTPHSVVVSGEGIQTYLEECGSFMATLREVAARYAPQLKTRPFPEIFDEVIDALPDLGFNRWSNQPGENFSAATLFNCMKQALQ